MRSLLALTCFAFAFHAQAKSLPQDDLAIVDLAVIQQLNIPLVYAKKEHGVGVARLSEQSKRQLSKHMHERGRCGGFELLSLQLDTNSGPFRSQDMQKLETLFQHMPKAKSAAELKSLRLTGGPKFDDKIGDKVKLVSEANLRRDLEWLSSYSTRRHDTPTKNAHVEEMQQKLNEIAKTATFPVKVDLIGHSRTGQKTVRARLEGSSRATEVVVLGAHFDSINQSWWGGDQAAPGADDDGSGSVNLLEVFRILVAGEQPQRSIEFLWYAAEEVGLVGSAEVASDYRARNVDVVAALQLDMTLFPGDGELTMALMTDFTSPWLNEYLKTLNQHYIRARVIEDRCGYGCSDHASWNRQGYASAIPFEASFDRMNKNIHTSRDVIDGQSSFKHSAAFTQLALAYALSLGNSTDRQP